MYPRQLREPLSISIPILSVYLYALNQNTLHLYVRPIFLYSQIEHTGLVILQDGEKYPLFIQYIVPGIGLWNIHPFFTRYFQNLVYIMVIHGTAHMAVFVCAGHS